MLYMTIKIFKSSLIDKKMKNNFYITFVIPLVALFMLMTSTPAFSWGPLGHKAICDSAWRASRDDVKSLLAETAKRMGFNTYAESCVWADKVRSNNRYNWLKPLHYMNITKGDTSVSLDYCENKNRNKPTCVLTAIEYFYAQWRDSSLSQAKRDEALLLFSHFTADIHQPLHVAYKDDRGGTRRNVIFEGKLMSLHSLWDGDILYCGIKTNWRNLGKKLLRSHRRYRQEQSDSSLKWAEESFALTRLIYVNLSQRLESNYCDDFHPLAMVRLELASLRLTRLLNASNSTSVMSSKVNGDTADSGGKEGDAVQSAPNLINRLIALWKSILI